MCTSAGDDGACAVGCKPGEIERGLYIPGAPALLRRHGSRGALAARGELHEATGDGMRAPRDAHSHHPDACAIYPAGERVATRLRPRVYATIDSALAGRMRSATFILIGSESEERRCIDYWEPMD